MYKIIYFVSSYFNKKMFYLMARFMRLTTAGPS